VSRVSLESTDEDSLVRTEAQTAVHAEGEVEAEPETEPQPPQPRRPRPVGGRCDACHERGARVVRSRDGLLTVCTRCARGVDVPNSDSADAIAAVVNRAPIAERRVLMRRLLARRALHTARRDRKSRPRPASQVAPGT
jgi:hypothetical protein